eukprot:194686_1
MSFDRTTAWPSSYPARRHHLKERCGDIPLSEVHEHNSRNDLWVTFNGNVYDLSRLSAKKKKLKKKLLFAGGQDLEPLHNLFRDHYRGNEMTFIDYFKIGHLS